MLSKKQKVRFGGKEQTVEEFIVRYDLEDESEISIKSVLNKLSKKGKLSFIEEKNPSKVTEGVEKKNIIENSRPNK